MANETILTALAAEEQPKFESVIRAEMDRQGITVGILDKQEDGKYLVSTMRARWEGWLGCAVYRFNNALAEEVEC